jgi:restriction system protein
MANSEISEASDLPTYGELLHPVLRAVATLGGSATSGEITAQVVEDQGFTEEQMSVFYDGNPKSILGDRLAWARSYNKLGGALESPKRSLYLLTAFGKEILALPEDEARQRLREMDRKVRSERSKKKRREATTVPFDAETGGVEDVDDEVIEELADDWKTVLLRRLHQLTPEGFEEFVLYLLRSYGLELTRVGGSGDEGLDGIGLAPISDVLSSRVAVQAKRHDPFGSSRIGREVVALFQRDAAAAGAERAVLVTLGTFSGPARKAAIIARPTVDLIDGNRVCELVEAQGVGIRSIIQVKESWFDRFDS